VAIPNSSLFLNLLLTTTQSYTLQTESGNELRRANAGQRKLAPQEQKLTVPWRSACLFSVDLLKLTRINVGANAIPFNAIASPLKKASFHGPHRNACLSRSSVFAPCQQAKIVLMPVSFQAPRMLKREIVRSRTDPRSIDILHSG
jgi:hypothetical protein